MKEFTLLEVSRKTRLNYNQIRSRMKSRDIKGKILNDVLIFDEFELEVIARQRNIVVDFPTEQAIIERYLKTTENQINRICDYFQVSPVTVHRIINQHFNSEFVIFESKMNDENFAD